MVAIGRNGNVAYPIVVSQLELLFSSSRIPGDFFIFSVR